MSKEPSLLPALLSLHRRLLLPQHSHRSRSPGWLSLHPGRIPPRQWRATSIRTATREQLSRWHSHARGPEDWHVFLDPGVRGHMPRGHLGKVSSYNPIATSGYSKVLRMGSGKTGLDPRSAEYTQHNCSRVFCLFVYISDRSFACLLRWDLPVHPWLDCNSEPCLLLPPRS